MIARFLNFTAAFVIGFVVGILLLVVFTNLAQFAGRLRLYGENLKVRPSGPNSTVNEGSFEIPANFNDTSDEPIVQGCKKICGGSTTLAPWQISKRGVPSVQNCANALARDAVAWCRDDNPFGGKPPQEDIDMGGHFFVDLTGFAGRPSENFGSIQQNVEDTTPGAKYELRFFVGTSSSFPPPDTGDDDGNYELTVTITGVKQPYKFTYLKTTDLIHWDPVIIQFNAPPQGGTTIGFSASGTDDRRTSAHFGGNFLGIDNVSVRRADCTFAQVISGCR